MEVVENNEGFYRGCCAILFEFPTPRCLSSTSSSRLVVVLRKVWASLEEEKKGEKLGINSMKGVFLVNYLLCNDTNWV